MELLGGEDSLRQQTLKIRAEVARLRANRLQEEKQIEEVALGEVRKLVSELRDLKHNLDAAEQAAQQYVERVAAVAGQELQQELRAEAKAKVLELSRAENLDLSVERSLLTRASAVIGSEGGRPVVAAGAGKTAAAGGGGGEEGTAGESKGGSS